MTDSFQITDSPVKIMTVCSTIPGHGCIWQQKNILEKKDSMVLDNEFDNEHVQILFLDNNASNSTSGKLTYCDAFYDSQGNLL